MQIDPTMPFHVARAYGATRPNLAPITPVTPVDRQAPTQTSGTSTTQANTARLIAARVPGGIDFTSDVATPTRGESLAMYRHPADKNAAAVNVQAGRLLDVKG